MSNYPILERIFWFDGQIRKGLFPNAPKISRRFEISIKTAQRAISFLRDRLDAPLEYDFARRGYYYSDDSYELPLYNVTHDEILAVLLARNLLSNSAGGFIGKTIEKFARKLFRTAGQVGLTERMIQEGFSASWHGHSPTYLETFRVVADALLKRRPVAFSYSSPGSGQTTSRTVEPHHLQYYMASWVLLAWCRKRNDWRKFVLARITDLKILEGAFEPRPRKSWDHLVGKSFGIFQGRDPREVKLRFNPFRARWIKEQVWHPEQKMTLEGSGALVLAFPVSDYREVSMKILQFGADVEVLAPGDLRDEISAEIRKMAGIY